MSTPGRLNWNDKAVGAIVPIVSAADVRNQLSLPTSDFDPMLVGYVMAVQSAMQNETRRVMQSSQTREALRDSFPTWATMRVPFGPVLSVESLDYWDSDTADWVVWDSANYSVDTSREPGYIVLPSGNWPTPGRLLDGVRIQYTAGTTADSASGNIARQAVLLGAAEAFEVRTPVDQLDASTLAPWVRQLIIGDWPGALAQA